MMLDDIKADETYEIFSVDPWIDNLWETECLVNAFTQNANDYEFLYHSK